MQSLILLLFLGGLVACGGDKGTSNDTHETTIEQTKDTKAQNGNECDKKESNKHDKDTCNDKNHNHTENGEHKDDNSNSK